MCTRFSSKNQMMIIILDLRYYKRNLIVHFIIAEIHFLIISNNHLWILNIWSQGHCLYRSLFQLLWFWTHIRSNDHCITYFDLGSHMRSSDHCISYFNLESHMRSSNCCLSYLDLWSHMIFGSLILHEIQWSLYQLIGSWISHEI